VSALMHVGHERIRFPSGAPLAARDLDAWMAYNARLRRLHLRGLHDTWGVALGYEVWPNTYGTAVLVGPGLAYDCHGRELVSGRTVTLLPPDPPRGSAYDWWVDLLLAYKAPLGARDDVCPGGAEERPVFRWSFAAPVRPLAPKPSLAEDVRRGEELPLARFLLAQGRLAGAADLGLRPAVQRLANPRLGSGHVERGALPIAGPPAAWSVRVDTRAAQFTRTPFYQVTLDRHPLAQDSAFAAVVAQAMLASLHGPFLSLEQASTTGFTLRVRIATNGALPAALQKRVSATLPVGLDWVGVEPPTRCPPSLYLIGLLAAPSFAFLADAPTEGSVITD
jgi:hypothetical protein